MNFQLFSFLTTSVVLTISAECNEKGREEGSVATYGEDEVTGRVTVLDVSEYIGEQQKRVAIANALRTAAHAL